MASQPLTEPTVESVLSADGVLVVRYRGWRVDKAYLTHRVIYDGFDLYPSPDLYPSLTLYPDD